MASPRAAISKAVCSSWERPSASASSRTVALRGARPGPRSRSLIARALSPARSASSSWLRRALTR